MDKHIKTKRIPYAMPVKFKHPVYKNTGHNSIVNDRTETDTLECRFRNRYRAEAGNVESKVLNK